MRKYNILLDSWLQSNKIMLIRCKWLIRIFILIIQIVTKSNTKINSIDKNFSPQDKDKIIMLFEFTVKNELESMW
jgi:hypothetical protein